MDIKPIETVYNGYKFRSRLEARWAVFFDVLKIKYEYEFEGYNLNGIYYLPDFWLPEISFFGSFAEVKPTRFNKDEYDKCEMLSRGTDKGCIMLGGSPAFETYPVIEICAYWDKNNKEYGIIRDGCEDDPPMINLAHIGLDRIFEKSEKEIVCAIFSARQARFEFGENGSNNVLQPTQEGAVQSCTE